MNKRGKSAILGTIITLILFVSVSHTALHFIFYQTNISLTKLVGVSGMVVQNLTIDEEFEETFKKENPWVFSGSAIILGLEWIFLFVLVGLSIVGHHKSMKKHELKLTSLKHMSFGKTDIDLVYELLKENKKLYLTSIAQVFKVGEKTVEEWCDILENEGLVTINYPRFGEAFISLNEKEIKK